MESDNTFNIDDYEQYFKEGSEETASGESVPSEDTPVSDDSVNENFSNEVLDTEQQYELLDSTVQDINSHLINIETLSICILVAVGLIVGIILSKIFLDKLWR